MKKYSILVFLIFVFLITRLATISSNPPSLYWDEVSIGYNAYSILTTGKDEWGEFLPLHFRAFGEFKLPIFIYAVAVSEALLGLTEFAVRLPSVLFSLGSLILVFLITKKLTRAFEVGLLAVFFFSLSAWMGIFSYAGYEATAGLMFYLLGILLFLYTNKKPFFLLLSVISFILSIYSYNSFRILVPITFIYFAYVLFKEKVSRNVWRIALLGILIFSISIVPIIRGALLDSGTVRLQTISIFNNSSTVEIIKNFTINYTSHFAPEFLLLGDKNIRSQQPRFGQIYFLDIPLLFLGVLLALKKKKLFLLPVFFIIVGIIPAAITKESPHSLRAISVSPFLSIVTALGFFYLIGILRKKISAPQLKVLVTLLLLLYLIQPLIYSYNFLFNYPKLSSLEWQYPYKEIYKNYSDEFKNYDQILITDRFAQPYIFALFYLKIHPEEFKRGVEYESIDKWGFSTVKRINNLSFLQISEKELPVGHLLIFASPEDKLPGIVPKATIKDLSGKDQIYVYEVDSG